MRKLYISGYSPYRSQILQLGMIFLVFFSATFALPDPVINDEMILEQKTNEEALSEEMSLSENTALSEGVPISEIEDFSKDVISAINVAELQGYQNNWDGVLCQRCPKGYGVYRVKSKHDNGKEDRRWEFFCRRVVSKKFASTKLTCSQTSYINNFRDTISYMCGKNRYMAGVYSYHSNAKEDRRWRITCCSAPSYITRDCYLTNYVNALDRPMNYCVRSNEVITGVVSYYSARTRYVYKN